MRSWLCVRCLNWLNHTQLSNSLHLASTTAIPVVDEQLSVWEELAWCSAPAHISSPSVRTPSANGWASAAHTASAPSSLRARTGPARTDAQEPPVSRLKKQKLKRQGTRIKLRRLLNARIYLSRCKASSGSAEMQPGTKYTDTYCYFKFIHSDKRNLQRWSCTQLNNTKCTAWYSASAGQA